MKKLVILFLTVFVVLAFAGSCKSAPAETPPAVVQAAPPPPAPAPAPAPAPQPPAPSPPAPVTVAPPAPPVTVAPAVAPAPANSGISTCKLGQYEVYMLVDAERDGNLNIVPGADNATVSRYVPASGFKHSTDLFLIKAPGLNILVDTGFGNTVFEKLEKLGVKPAQIDAILLTHLHGDHTGGLQKDGKPLFPNAKIYLDSRELDHFTRIAPNDGAVAAMKAYGSNVITFDAFPLGPIYREVLPGICAIANYGHTPGHTAYLVGRGRDKFIIAGDFLHVALIQFPNPDISATYDMDQRAAAVSRRQILNFAVSNDFLIGGMHIVYPGIGNVEANGNGFRFIPLR